MKTLTFDIHGIYNRMNSVANNDSYERWVSDLTRGLVSK